METYQFFSRHEKIDHSFCSQMSTTDSNYKELEVRVKIHMTGLISSYLD